MKLALEHPKAGNGAGRERENIYRDLFEEAPIACFSVGADGRIRMANRRALELLAYQLDELIGRPVLDLYADTPAGKTRAQELFLQFRAGVEIRGEELEMRRADGAHLWVSLSVGAIRDAKGQVEASCSVAEEITKGKSPQESPQTGHDRRRRAFDDGNHIAQQFAALLKDFKFERKRLERLMIKSAGRFHFLRVQELDWIEAAGNYVQLHVGSKSHLLRETMNGLEAKLDPYKFLRIHRSAIVNIERIKELQPWYCGDYKVVLQDGTQLTLSRGYREKLQELLGKSL